MTTVLSILGVATFLFGLYQFDRWLTGGRNKKPSVRRVFILSIPAAIG